MDELKKEPFFKQTNLNLDQEVVFLAGKKLYEMTGNKRMLSSFVNRVLTEFVCDGSDHPDMSIRQQARELADQIRKEKMSQRKLIEDEETRKAEQIRQDRERRELIKIQTMAAVRKLGFKREYLRDRAHMCYSGKRDALADEVSIACRLDLQWKDLYPVVAAIVFEDVAEVTP